MTMPTFLIIGANKAGTTSLYHYLNQHPEVFMSPIKEPMFFSHDGKKPKNIDNPSHQKVLKNAIYTLEDYQALFRNATNEKAIGEASTSYLHCAWTAKNVNHHLPEIKLIAILRNPVERAYSNYLMYVRWGFESLSFADAIKEEENRIFNNYPMGWHYVRLGFYYELLKQYFDLFDRSQIRVYLYEDLQTDPVSLMKNIFQFIGIDETFVPDMSIKYNQSNQQHKDFSPLSIELRKQLIEIYQENINSVQELIQRDLSGWLDVSKEAHKAASASPHASSSVQIADLKRLIASKDAHIGMLEQRLAAIENTRTWGLALKWYAFKRSLLQLANAPNNKMRGIIKKMNLLKTTAKN